MKGTEPKAQRPSLRLAVVAVIGLMIGVGLAHSGERSPSVRDQVLQLNNLTGQDAFLGVLRKLADDPKLAKQMIAEGRKLVGEKDSPLNYTAATVLARLAQLFKDDESARAFYRFGADQAIALGSTNKIIEAFDGMISSATAAKKYDEVIKICQELLELKGDEQLDKIKPLVLTRLIRAQARSGKTDAALKLTDSLLEKFDGTFFQIELTDLKANVYREAGQYNKAIEVYLDLLDLLQESPGIPEKERVSMTQRARYFLAGVYSEAGEPRKAIAQLRTLVKEKPDSSTFNNDLGYIMADNDIDLDEAEKYIRRAIELDRKQRAEQKLPASLDKDNAAYLDSLGWVLYKRKQYAEAKKILLQAIELEDGQHIEIYDHLAETHLALGEKKEALAVWRKALELEDISRRDQQRRAEIRNKIKRLEEKD